MGTVETKAYKFDELSEEAQERAIEKYGDCNIDYEWWDYDGMLDLTVDEMKSRRIKMVDNVSMLFEYGGCQEVFFSLNRGRDFYIQFDEIEVTDDDLFRKFLRIPKTLWEKCDYRFVNNYRNNWPYGTPNTWLEIETNWTEFTGRQQAIVDRACEIMADKIAEALDGLEKEYEYITSEESIIDSIKANECEFTGDGDLV